MARRHLVAQERSKVLELPRVVLHRERSRALAQHARGALVAARRAAHPQVDAAGEKGLQHPELLGHLERAVVREHHATRAHPDVTRHRGHLGDQHLGAGPGQAGRGVMLGQPVPMVAPALRRAGELEGLVDGVRGRASAAHRRLVEDPDAHRSS
jgi:hypothetical protein